jgi:NAD(P)-dependent dehydrogenase (short-subunit alcohol dehydrogenase family)
MSLADAEGETKTMSRFGLAGRVALITGAGRGIGREIAETLAGHGSKVIVAEFDRESGERAVEELKGAGHEAWFVPVDVSDANSVRAMADEADRLTGGLDILVNNAGIARSTPAEQIPDSEWLAVMDVNLNGVFWCCREVGRRMLERGRGSIVNIASMSGLVVNDPQPQAAYNVSKAGVIMLTKSLAFEWAKRGVRVNCVSPGYIATDLVNEVLRKNSAWKERWVDLTPVGRLGKPSDVAEAVLYLASDAAEFAVGTNLVIDGGYTSV